MAAPFQADEGPERLAVGGGGGGEANEPTTLPPVMARVDGAPRVPMTEKRGSFFQTLGAPGAIQVILSLEAGTGTREPPPKTLAQSLAPAATNLSFPAMVPSSTVPAKVPQGAPVFPKVALTLKISEWAVPPVVRGRR